MKLIFILIFIISACSVNQKDHPIKRSPATKAKVIKKGNSCLFRTVKQLTHSRPGLVPETSRVNTIIIGFQDGGSEKTLTNLFEQIDSETNVILVAIDGPNSSEFVKKLSTKANVTIVDTDSWGSYWVRDWIPQKVVGKDGRVKFVNLTYTAKSFSYDAPTMFAKAFKLPHYESWVTGEMGNIMVDGKKNLFVTTKILEDNLSLRITKKDINSELKSAFGVKKVFFLPPHPRDGGVNHVDLIAKYVGKINGEETVLVSQSKKPDVKKALDQSAEVFKSLGHKVIRIEEYPEKIGRGAPGFVNSLIYNKKVYMPVYSKGLENPDPKLIKLEKKARKVYEKLGFEVFEVDSAEPIRGMGAVHCLTCAGDF